MVLLWRRKFALTDVDCNMIVLVIIRLLTLICHLLKENEMLGIIKTSTAGIYSSTNIVNVYLRIHELSVF